MSCSYNFSDTKPLCCAQDDGGGASSSDSGGFVPAPAAARAGRGHALCSDDDDSPAKPAKRARAPAAPAARRSLLDESDSDADDAVAKAPGAPRLFIGGSTGLQSAMAEAATNNLLLTESTDFMLLTAFSARQPCNLGGCECLWRSY